MSQARPTIAGSLVVRKFVHNITVQAKNPCLDIPLRNKSRNLVCIVSDDRNSSLLQCLVKLPYTLPHTVQISVYDNDQLGTRLATPASFNFNHKSLSNPLLCAPSARWRLFNSH